ncbi:hypothetical protein Gorai_006459 [Gossypium raimondii]|uniref:DUF4283 domain-containing protein n=1 Tax=Gossypium raimondii TaxID=29730 RepID=A0A7J8QFC5_GOSRA|nr:hypothetical protein [Gossypium raimondii]
MVLEGRPWLFRRQLIIFEGLLQAMECNNIHLTSSPFWLKNVSSDRVAATMGNMAIASASAEK